MVGQLHILKAQVIARTPPCGNLHAWDRDDCELTFLKIPMVQCKNKYYHSQRPDMRTSPPDHPCSAHHTFTSLSGSPATAWAHTIKYKYLVKNELSIQTSRSGHLILILLISAATMFSKSAALSPTLVIRRSENTRIFIRSTIAPYSSIISPVRIVLSGRPVQFIRNLMNWSSRKKRENQIEMFESLQSEADLSGISITVLLPIIHV